MTDEIESALASACGVEPSYSRIRIDRHGRPLGHWLTLESD
jgi:hypothetical protein